MTTRDKDSDSLAVFRRLSAHWRERVKELREAWNDESSYYDFETCADELDAAVAGLLAQPEKWEWTLKQLASYLGWGYTSDEETFKFAAERERLLRGAQALLETHKSDAPTAELAIKDRVAGLLASPQETNWTAVYEVEQALLDVVKCQGFAQAVDPVRFCFDLSEALRTAREAALAPQEEPPELRTECCGVTIQRGRRFCPKCGYEARVAAADAPQEEPREVYPSFTLEDWQNIEMSVISECGEEYGRDLVFRLNELRQGAPADAPQEPTD